MATAKQQVLKLLSAALKRFNGLLTRADNLSSISDIDRQFKKAITEINKIVKNSKALFGAANLSEIYRDAYNEIGKLFKGQVAIGYSTIPQGTTTAPVKEMQKRFNRAMGEMGKMAKFNLDERKRMQKEALKSLTSGLKKSGVVKSAAELEKITAGIVDSFAPASGVRKFRNEYYGLGAKDRGRKIFEKTWLKGWDKLSKGMTRTIVSGIKNGETSAQINKGIIKRLSKSFPTTAKDAHFPIPIRGKDGQIGIRRLGMKYYAELKEGETATRIQSAGTVNGTLDAGYDIVEYNLHGAQDHTEICLELSNEGSGKRYSITGESNVYPQLTVYPPAHYNCHSTIDPVQLSKQEEVDATKSDKKSAGENILKTPQEDQEDFEKTGGKKSA